MYLSRARDCRVYSHVRLLLHLSVSDRVAAERWCAGLFCVLLSHHLCGFCISYAVLGAQLGFSVPRHLHMTSRVPFRNGGRHTCASTSTRGRAPMPRTRAF